MIARAIIYAHPQVSNVTSRVSHNYIRLTMVKLGGSPIVIIVILIIVNIDLVKFYIRYYTDIQFSKVDPFFVLFSSKLGGQQTR